MRRKLWHLCRGGYQQPPEVVEKFGHYRKGELIISSITCGELCCGIHKSGKPIIDALLEFLEVIAFDRKAAEIFASLSIQHLSRRANFDRLIAAHSIASGVSRVTNNVADFAVYEGSGLIVENWVK